MAYETGKGDATGAADPTIEKLIDSLASDDAAVNESARQSLVAMQARAVPYLVKGLADRRRHVRWEVAKTLGEVRSTAAAPALVKALDDRSFDVRWTAAEALISLGPDAAVPVLEALIKRSKSLTFREGAHHILNHLAGGDVTIDHHSASHPRATPNLVEALKPVVAALGDTAPTVEVPLEAQKALEAITIAKRK